MTGRDADARRVIAARGFDEAFGHSLGQALESAEAPRVA
jgi:hypothetical protein